MQEIKSVVLTQEDLDASPFLLGLGALTGDTLTVSRPDAVNNTGDTQQADKAPDQNTAPAEQAAPGGVPAEGAQNVTENTSAENPKEGDPCTTDAGAPGVLQFQGSKAAGGSLVCVPTGGDSAGA